MKVKLQSSSKLCLVKAVKELADLGLKEAKDLVDEQEKVFGCPPNAKWCVVIDSEKTEEQIKAKAKECDATYTLVDVCEPMLQEETTAQETKESRIEAEMDKLLEKCGTFIEATEEGIKYKLIGLFEKEHTVRVNATMRDCHFKVSVEAGEFVSLVTIENTFAMKISIEKLKRLDNLVHKLLNKTIFRLNVEEILRDISDDVDNNVDDICDLNGCD